MQKIIRFITTKYDILIYTIIYKLTLRMCFRRKWLGYLLELHIKDWNKRNPIEDELKKTIEKIYFNYLMEKWENIKKIT